MLAVTLLFLCFVACGAFVQTITGFAMGLIIMGGVVSLRLVEIHTAAAVVSLISLVNAGVALRSTWRFISWPHVKWLSLGMLPFVAVGVTLLEWLSGESSDLLRMFLGFVIIAAGTLLMLKPAPYKRESPAWIKLMVGAAGGLIGGLYGAGGAPPAYLMYRQPLELAIVRATLLAVFASSTIFRTISVTVAGQMDRQILVLTAVSIPVVVFMTWLASRVQSKLPDVIIRKAVFALLIVIGLFLMLR